MSVFCIVLVVDVILFFIDETFLSCIFSNQKTTCDMIINMTLLYFVYRHTCFYITKYVLFVYLTFLL